MRSVAAVLAVILCSACATAPRSDPRPNTWRGETIPMPLEFAPSLPYRGSEELRFAPGFFDPKAPGFWTYAFAWFVERSPELTVDNLARDLEAYFVGLARAVGKRGEFDAAAVRASLAPHPARRKGAEGFAGTIHVLDPFDAIREVDLTFEGDLFDCGERRVLVVALAPQALTADLHEVADAFSCLGAAN